MIILALDPSGAFNEGKGTTGFSVWAYNSGNYKLLRVGQIAAIDFTCSQDYWNEHIKLLKTVKPNVLVMEDFLLYAHKAKQQIGSKMETPKMIGIIEFECARLNINVIMQRAVDVKKRWNDDILVYKGIITKESNHYNIGSTKNISKHIRDSLRHGIHYITKLRLKECKKQNQ